MGDSGCASSLIVFEKIKSQLSVEERAIKMGNYFAPGEWAHVTRAIGCVYQGHGCIRPFALTLFNGALAHNSRTHTLTRFDYAVYMITIYLAIETYLSLLSYANCRRGMSSAVETGNGRCSLINCSCNKSKSIFLHLTSLK
jgi:hypothetical protein